MDGHLLLARKRVFVDVSDWREQKILKTIISSERTTIFTL